MWVPRPQTKRITLLRDCQESRDARASRAHQHHVKGSGRKITGSRPAAPVGQRIGE